MRCSAGPVSRGGRGRVASDRRRSSAVDSAFERDRRAQVQQDPALGGDQVTAASRVSWTAPAWAGPAGRAAARPTLIRAGAPTGTRISGWLLRPSVCSLCKVMSGSTSGCWSRWARPRSAYGTCAGMIMLADRIEGGTADQETIGGLDVTVRRNAFGRQVDSFEEDLDFAGIEGPIHAVFIRAPWVEEAGPSVEVLARVVGGPAAGRIVAVQQGPLMATSFHPEVGGGERIHRRFLDLVSQS